MVNLDDQIITIIPIRMASSRLPGKFHAEIGEKAMILHVLDRARESGFKNIWIACDDQHHLELVQNYGGNAVLTSIEHQSGSDRIFEALQLIDREEKFSYIINLQGDMPFFDPIIIKQVAEELINDQQADIATILAPITDANDINNPNVVKAVFNNKHHALYFSRLPIPYAIKLKLSDNYFKHVGIYAYRRQSLANYIKLPQSKLEISESLEQLRALENGMTIHIGFNANVPISVDTPEDLEAARKFYIAKKCAY